LVIFKNKKILKIYSSASNLFSYFGLISKLNLKYILTFYLFPIPIDHYQNKPTKEKNFTMRGMEYACIKH
jgi:hypothetical protein